MSLVGKTIGNYKVTRLLGEGGMGVVYLAEHPVIGRQVAIKLLHTGFAKDTETVARFFNEARAIHMISHPNIVEVLDFGQTADGQPYFIMEFLSGESLAEPIARGPIPAYDAIAIATQICDALQAAHDKRIIHRDLKPHNIYLAGDGHPPLVKILDFGVAKMIAGWDTAQSGGQSVKTRTGSLMGTPLYMSPEQCRGSGKLDHRTDIYSLGVILFEMISGRPPFMAEGVGELFAKHMLEAAPSLAEVAPGAPPHVVRAVGRALAKNLDDRFSTMRAMRDALEGKPDPNEIAAPAAAAPAPAAPPAPPAARSPPSPVATLSRGNPAVSASALDEQSTTLSSAVSELDSDLDRLPTRSLRGVAVGIVALAAVVGVALLAGRKAQAPQAAAGAVANAEPATAPPPQPEAEAAAGNIEVRFEAEPAHTHVFGSASGRGPSEDLGPVPLALKLGRRADTADFVLRAAGYKDRPVTIHLARDQLLHFVLDPQPPASDRIVKEADKKKPDRRVVKPHRVVTHDADGLAVPSF